MRRWRKFLAAARVPRDHRLALDALPGRCGLLLPYTAPEQA
ncbi:hypothetical protein ACIRP7_10175 [Streptomyces sp. NPDC102270]